MKRGIVFALIPVVLATACDMLRLEPFEVVGWSPGCQDAGGTGSLSFGVVFSLEPDRASAESAFSLKENGETVYGDFIWDGPSLSFVPYCVPEPNSEYRLSVSTDARTSDGLSLEDTFEVEFSTKAESLRPRVLSTVPPHGGTIPAGMSSVSVTFSEAVEATEFYANVSASPGIPGIWKLNETSDVASFTPLEPWDAGVEYEISVSGNTADRSGNRMGDDLSFRFSVGTDTLSPELIALNAVDGSGSVVLSATPDDMTDTGITVNAGWEKSWRLQARFSEPVRIETIDAHVECMGGACLKRLTSGTCSDEIVFTLESLPECGEGFIARFNPGVEDTSGNCSASAKTYRFIADGPESRPPRFIGIRMPMAPGAVLTEDRELAVFSTARPFETIALASDADRFPIGVATRITLECFFELARGATLDRLSLMESLRASATNGALDLHVTGIRLGGFDYARTPVEWSELAIALVDGTLTNRAASGVFSIQFASGLKDSSGNVNESPQKLSMLK